jgi:hypothetical protein
MDDLAPKARWTITQPWRGIFGLVVTISYVLVITSIFEVQFFLSFYTLLIMSMVPILVMMCLGWGGKYPSTEGLPQPWRGILLTGFVVLLGTLVCMAVRTFLSGGVAQPFANIYLISTVLTTFFLILAFGMWPFGKLSFGVKGWFTLILAFLLMWFLLKLYDFSLLSFPTGVNPSPVKPVPFYAEGGPFQQFAALAPRGPFLWEYAITFYFWMLVFLFAFANLGMWPFNKSPKLMKQPLFGIVLTLVCAIFAWIAFSIAVNWLKIEPLTFLLSGICWAFGVLMIMTLLQMWPGRVLKQPAWGCVNILLAIGIGIVAYYPYKAFAVWHFGKAMVYPNDIFILANMMLGITFPAWVAYTDLWDFWPLPPTPAPPNPQ